MRIFLTGATGFIGSHLIPELLGAGEEDAHGETPMIVDDLRLVLAPVLL